MDSKIYTFELPTEKDENVKLSEFSPVNYEVEVSVRQWTKKEAVVIIVWKWWTVQGYMNKYGTITNNIAEKHSVNVFVVENPWISWDNPELFFDCAIKFVDKKMHEFWFDDYYISAMWFSAWWHFLWRFAYKYPVIKQILLVNPVLRVNFTKLKDALNEFTWKIRIIQWDKDVDFFYNPLLKQIPRAKVYTLDWVDHQFSNEWWLEMFIWLPDKYLFDK